MSILVLVGQCRHEETNRENNVGCHELTNGRWVSVLIVFLVCAQLGETM